MPGSRGGRERSVQVVGSLVAVALMAALAAVPRREHLTPQELRRPRGSKPGGGYREANRFLVAQRLWSLVRFGVLDGAPRRRRGPVPRR